MRRTVLFLSFFLLLPGALGYAGYTDAATIILDNQSLRFASETDSTSLTLTVQDDAIYALAHYSFAGQEWESFNLTGAQTGGWITSGQAIATLTVPSGESTDNYIIIYSCSSDQNSGMQPSAWDCHGSRWQIIQFNTGIEPAPSTADYLFDDIDLFDYGKEQVVASAAAMQTAIAEAKPGDAIVIADGTYTNVRLTMSADGTVEQPIIIRPQTPGGVTFTGSTAITLTSENVIMGGFSFEDVAETIFTYKGATNNRVTGNAFFQCGTKQPFAQKVVLFTDQAQDNRLDHNLFKCVVGSTIGVEVRMGTAESNDIDTATCTLKSGTAADHVPDIYNYNNTIDHNVFKDIPSVSSIEGGFIYGGAEWNDGEAIQLGYGATGLGLCPTHTTIVYNLFDTACGDYEIISSKASNDTISHNTFMRSRSPSSQYRRVGVSIRGGVGTVMDGNYYLNGTSLSVNGEYHAVTNNYFEGYNDFATMTLSAGDGVARHNLFAHNTFVNFGRRALLVGRDCTDNDEPPAYNTYANNLFATTIMETKAIDVYCQGEETIENNLLWINDGREGDWDEGYEAINPELEMTSVNGYTLGLLIGSSPAIDAGAAVGVRQDLFGGERDDHPDIGAEEYGSDHNNQPLQAADLLPEWMNDYVTQECDLW